MTLPRYSNDEPDKQKYSDCATDPQQQFSKSFADNSKDQHNSGEYPNHAHTVHKAACVVNKDLTYAE